MESLPVQQLDAFNQIMTRIRTAEHSVEIAFRILSWIFYAARPLRMIELRHALVIEDGDRDIDKAKLRELQSSDILDCCQSLVVCEKSSEIVRFAHPTVHEFLQSQNIAPITYLAKTCLAYLGLDIFESPCLSKAEHEERLTNYAFGRYAGEFWGIHVQGDPENIPEIQEAILRVFGLEKRRISLHKIWTYFRIRPGLEETVLHISARNGLSTFCKLLVNGR
jgi:hypothetical protein